MDSYLNVDAHRLRAELVHPGGVWTSVTAVASTGSTNADLVVAAAGGAASGTVLVAEHQTAGRGRFSRVWRAPAGKSLAISVLLRPPEEIPVHRWPWLSLITGVAVADGLRSACGLAAVVKWPNDVLIGPGKVCGILAERAEGGGLPAVVIGMGINTSLAEEELPAPNATSLALSGVEADPTAIAATVLNSLAVWYEHWADGDDLREEYVARCSSVGRTVRVQTAPDDFTQGVATDVDSGGRLVVDLGTERRSFGAGDVVHLR